MTIPASTPTGFQPADAERVQNQADLNALLGAFSGDVLKAANGGTGVGTSPLPIANGGTGSATQNFVDLSTAQATIAGAKTFTTGVSITHDSPLIIQRGTGSQGKNSGVLFKDQAGSNKAAIGTEGAATNDLQIMVGDGIGSGGAVRFYTNSDLVSTNERGKFDANGTFVLLGGFQVGVVSKTANYGAGSTDYLILCNATGGAFTITLPAATKTGQILAIVKTDASINAVTVARAGADTIEGVNSKALALQYDKITLIADGTSIWYDLGKGLI